MCTGCKTTDVMVTRWNRGYYRPQRSCEGYVFTRVCLSTGGGVPDKVHPPDQVHPPGPGTTPRPGTPPKPGTPPDQVHLPGPGTPSGPGTPHR